MTTKNGDYLTKIENNINSNQSKLSMVLGALIILVIGILIFNYFNRSKPSLGPAQQTEQVQTKQDASPDQLPGKYTIKDGDTLFNIADKYYHDGYKYTEIAKDNNISNADIIETGQVIEIPKLTPGTAITSPEPQTSPSISGLGTGGGNTTIWGPRIEGNTYTVVNGDWLSKIAGRAYGDVFLFDKIAKANNITDANLIEPGTVLTIPR